ncbi:putative redox protein [Tamaricihabitans halophyticus]|uniref:Putative redox protein n=1 Tax=Tamaricihabitans halophyticus TaxID=1262583 RepID=A0A4R2QIG7_9PSEU|nr:bifunctional alpha/beta hydrolase/OsmC family protein [Tamaricihabitans halophyticus]TCP48464.1 putative redox protein [Tamaricihabitans halophyticus]
MRSIRLEFPGSHGAALAARLELPERRPRAFALFAHCFTCGKDLVAAARIARALTAHGIAVLRFDFTGLGESGGDFGHTDFSSNIEDVVLAADYLRAHYDAPSILIGHSLGGAAVLAAAHWIPETRAVATIAAPADPANVLGQFADDLAEIEQTGSAMVTLAGRQFPVRREFLADVTAQHQEERIRGLGAALLIMHSPTDDTVDVEQARRIYDTARHPKSFIALDGADHLLRDPADAAFVADTVAVWAERYLPEPESAAEPAEGYVVVSENGEGAYGQSISAGTHEFPADEPRPIGLDTGPSPYDLLLAALGACTSMTLRMYAERKKLPLEQVTVALRHEKVHAKDCAECESTEGKVDRIDRTVRLVGELTDQQRARLLEIADSCPVHRTLRSETVIHTVAEDA